MRELGVCLIVIFGAIVLAPFVIDQLFFFLLFGKIPFTNISLSATIMIIFWATIVPLVIFLRKSLSALVWKLVDVASEITQRRINRSIRYFTPNQKSEFILLSICLLYKMKTNEPNTKVESQKLAPSLT